MCFSSTMLNKYLNSVEHRDKNRFKRILHRECSKASYARNPIL